MISYLSNPHGELVWRLANPQGLHRRIARIDLGLYLQILSHTSCEATFRAQLWNDVRVETASEELWQALENEEAHANPWVLKATKNAAA
jgi:hypothetical protein